MRRALVPLLSAAVLLGHAGPAAAEDVGGLEAAPLIRQALLLRGGRHEVTASLGVSLGDAFVRGWAPPFGYTYYLFNWFGVGADFNYNVCSFLGGACKTDLAEQVEAKNPELDGADLSDLSLLTFMVTPYATLVPVTGKIGVLGSMVVNWDMHLLLGGALIGTDNFGSGNAIESGTAIAPVFGLGQRFYLGRSLAVTVSLRDYIVNRSLNAPTTGDESDNDPEKEVENIFMLTVGASFYFPTRVQTAQ